MCVHVLCKYWIFGQFEHNYFNMCQMFRSHVLWLHLLCSPPPLCGAILADEKYKCKPGDQVGTWPGLYFMYSWNEGGGGRRIEGEREGREREGGREGWRKRGREEGEREGEGGREGERERERETETDSFVSLFTWQRGWRLRRLMSSGFWQKCSTTLTTIVTVLMI